MGDERLGRRFAPDKRDHPMRAAIKEPTVFRAYRYWTPGRVLDQGQTPQCVAYAWTGWELATPIRDRLDDVTPPPDIYAECQRVDEWADEPHDGTSVRAGAKVMQAQGRIGEYVFETDFMTVKQWLLTQGPVVFGTNWYEAMFDPDAAGFVKIGGQIAGGHAYLVDGYSAIRQAIRCRNSWGADWANNGSFWLRAADAIRLLAEDGEACAAAEVKRP